MAADLTGAQIKDSVTEKTVYLETTAVSVTSTPGHGEIYDCKFCDNYGLPTLKPLKVEICLRCTICRS